MRISLSPLQVTFGWSAASSNHQRIMQIETSSVALKNCIFWWFDDAVNHWSVDIKGLRLLYGANIFTGITIIHLNMIKWSSEHNVVLRVWCFLMMSVQMCEYLYVGFEFCCFHVCGENRPSLDRAVYRILRARFTNGLDLLFRSKVSHSLPSARGSDKTFTLSFM